MFETEATFKDYYRITKTMNISKTYSPFGLDYMYIFFSKVTSNCQILEVHTHSVHVCNVKTKRTIFTFISYLHVSLWLQMQSFISYYNSHFLVLKVCFLCNHYK